MTSLSAAELQMELEQALTMGHRAGARAKALEERLGLKEEQLDEREDMLQRMRDQHQLLQLPDDAVRQQQRQHHRDLTVNPLPCYSHMQPSNTYLYTDLYAAYHAGS